MSARPYPPLGLPALDLLTEREFLICPPLVGFLYGLQVALAGTCINLLWRCRNGKSSQSYFFIGYVSLMCILGTLHFVAIASSAQFAYIDDWSPTDGPFDFFANQFLNPVYYMSGVAFVITSWLADGLLLWRCMLVWSGNRWRPFLTIPCLMYISSFALGCLSLAKSREPSGLSTSFNFSLPYFVMSLTINLTASSCIVLRLLVQRRRLRATGGKYGALYESIASVTSIAAMIIESAALYAVFNLCFTIPYIVGHPIAGVFLDLLGQIEIIAPLLIIYRVSRGRAWSTQTNTNLQRSMDMRFAPPQTATSATRVTGSGFSGPLITYAGELADERMVALGEMGDAYELESGSVRKANGMNVSLAASEC